MKTKPIYKNTVIMVKDVIASTKFYTEIMGEEVEFDFGSNIGFKSGLALWELRDYLPITKFLGSKRLKPSNTTKFELYYDFDDLENLYEKLKRSNVEFLHEIHEEPWGQRTLRFFDPDKHLVEVGEPLEAFVIRFSKEGMNAEQITKRTGVPVDMVKKILGQG